MYNTNSLKCYYLYLKESLLSIVSFICRFITSVTSLNFSNFDRQDFLKTQTFDGYDAL